MVLLGVPASWMLAEARADRIPHVRGLAVNEQVTIEQLEITHEATRRPPGFAPNRQQLRLLALLRHGQLWLARTRAPGSDDGIESLSCCGAVTVSCFVAFTTHTPWSSPARASR